jgi:hypothetical protein
MYYTELSEYRVKLIEAQDFIIMDHYYNDTNNNSPDKKTAIKSKTYGWFIASMALPTLLLLLTIISSAPTYPVQATGGGGNETEVTRAPGGASVGPAGSGTNVTQSDCLPQNATTGANSTVNAGGANTTTTTNNTSTTFAPSGASIGANNTSTLNATAGNTTTTNNTSTTFAPSGASIC